MPKATIRSSTGSVITIEGSQEEVARIISTLDKPIVVARAKHEIARAKVTSSQGKKREGAGDLIIGMREAGFFDKPKTLAEMEQSLEEKGFLYPTTTLSGVVLRLVKKKELRRKKTDGRWTYGK